VIIEIILYRCPSTFSSQQLRRLDVIVEAGTKPLAGVSSQMTRMTHANNAVAPFPDFRDARSKTIGAPKAATRACRRPLAASAVKSLGSSLRAKFLRGDWPVHLQSDRCDVGVVADSAACSFSKPPAEKE
jgi:hypothetical protein